MAKFEQKTIRDPLLGMVSDHLTHGHITCGITHQVGCELVALLAAYREEDRRLYPEVYLFGPSALSEFLSNRPRKRTINDPVRLLGEPVAEHLGYCGNISVLSCEQPCFAPRMDEQK